jgi:hypothetical protein
VKEWRDGDVFFWRYKNENEGFRYHCLARKAIVRSGKLLDIYWAYLDGRTVKFHDLGGCWSPEQADHHLILKFNGNLNEFDAIPDYNECMYDEADILDLRHINSSQKQVYLRKGARRNRVAMLAEVDSRIAKAEAEIRNVNWKLEQLNKEKEKIESGNLESVLL